MNEYWAGQKAASNACVTIHHEWQTSVNGTHSTPKGPRMVLEERGVDVRKIKEYLVAKASFEDFRIRTTKFNRCWCDLK